MCILVFLTILVCVYFGKGIYSISSGNFGWIQFGFITWSIYCAVIYILLSRSMMKNSGLLNVLKVISEPESEEIFDTKVICTESTRKITIKSACAVVILATINMAFSFINLTDVEALLPEMPEPIFYIFFVMQVVATYIFSFCYFLALPFVALPCYLMLQKVQTLLAYIEQKLNRNISSDDISSLCLWYDSLHSKNMMMNRVLSPIVMAVFCIFGPMEVCMMLSLFDSKSHVDISYTISWILLNAFLLAVVIKFICDLEAQSRRYLIEI